ncbi:hypothetical protein EAL2_808p00730 (plasmid) [Peptoclostridium acidaminophilum DSM 3953]|uniref:Uncharacterized protein n=1 Tax=Peptoclostridium acidaminophilum DSM 3953 TaxID=1286171 RepID=W8T9I3_PEPAC|nr:hypothetical protein [Peptoclostridium acidaminophilum]AHM57580.1 hypothetical protein EAL2_808p00730 [Peptoclostridium acidaminophilum DSM 3953]
MSAFLGKIHYWLFNKIQLHEELAGELLKAAADKGFDAGGLRLQGYERYGNPVQGALEDAINHANIHGWLQERIHSVEGRIAFTVTELLKRGALNMEDMAQIFSNSGSDSAKDLDISGASPQDMHRTVFDFMLEGMPCDRVSETLSSTEDEFLWRASRCLHSDFWEQAGGDVANYHILRDAWIKGFVEESGSGLAYSRTGDGISAIIRG